MSGNAEACSAECDSGSGGGVEFGNGLPDALFKVSPWPKAEKLLPHLAAEKGHDLAHELEISALPGQPVSRKEI